MTLGMQLAALLGAAGLVVAWLPGRQRWWRLAVPLSGVLPVMAVPMMAVRDGILGLMDMPAGPRAREAALTYVGLAEAEGHGMVVVALACLAYALVSGLKPSAEPEERIARAVTSTLALLSTTLLGMVIARDHWLAGRLDQDPMGSGLLVLGGTLLLGVGLLVLRRVTERPDHFAIQLVAGVMVACTMLLLRVPTHFAQERVLQYTVGGQVLAIERRYAGKLPTVPEGTALLPHEAADALTGDDWGWYSTSLGDPVDMPPQLAEPIPVALPTEAQASLLVQAPFGETERRLGLLIQVAPPDQRHPFEASQRYRQLSLLWMPRVEPTWSPDFPILSAEGGLQDLVDRCLEARAQRPDDPCRIARVGASPEPLAPAPRRAQ
jgi:hypothetical protein